MPNPPDWLICRPIAHRGLHGATTGAVENSLSAALGAIERDYAIECDVQLSADGEAMVFHDDDLGRLTAAAGPVAGLSARSLQSLRLRGTSEGLSTLPAFFERVAGRVPLICEVKSRFDGDARLAARVHELAKTYAGSLAIKSFDPAVVTHLRSLGCTRPLGIVTQATFREPEWARLPHSLLHELANLLHFERTRPDFLSFRVDDLPNGVPFLCRQALGLPVVTWTVRNPAQRQGAAPWADQIVFEGFLP